MTTLAYAKINLGLRVLERRPDGYHTIETIFHRIALADELIFTSAPTVRITSDTQGVPLDHTNICWRAAALLRDELQCNSGVDIHLHKRIPIGAGLGGGSADAAAVLLHLPAFWHRTLDGSTLRRIAEHLGADVPYFLQNGSAVGRGRGDLLEYFPLDIPYWILLCNPRLLIATAWAYARITPVKREAALGLKEILLEGLHDPEVLHEGLVNDFEPVVFAAYPIIREVKQEMERRGALFASMSGSGSSVYGFFEREDDARATARAFDERGFFTHLTPPHFAV